MPAPTVYVKNLKRFLSFFAQKNAACVLRSTETKHLCAERKHVARAFCLYDNILASATV